MGTKEKDFLKRLIETFRIEAEEHVKALSSRLLKLEKTPAEKQTEIIEIIYREVHSLKGAARAVDMTDIEEICQSLESVFASMKRQDIALSAELFDLLHETVDSLDTILLSSKAEQTPSEKTHIWDLIQRLEGIPKGNTPPSKQKAVKLPKLKRKASTKQEGSRKIKEEDSLEQELNVSRPLPDDKPLQASTIRVSTAKLDSLLLQTEELLSVKLATGQRATDLRGVISLFNQWKKEWTKVYPELRQIKPKSATLGLSESARSVEVLDRRLRGPKPSRLIEFLEWNNTHVKLLETKLQTVAKLLEQDHRSHSGMVDDLLENTKNILMFPFSSLLEIFPKMVRDLSRAQGKEVELVIHGEEVEIDKRILEEMKDPLIHLVRNCIDHGIEKPEERVRWKKPRRGTITVTISQMNSNNIEILVSDDGAGIDLKKLKERAIKSGVISKERADQLNEHEALFLIFQSEVSTSPMITDISGRGLGLAIVREKVEKLGSHTSVETEPNIGASFRILLPLTLATFRGILIRTADQVFVVPTASVEGIVRIKQGDIKTVENKESITLNGRAVSFVRLNDVLELPQKVKEGESSEFTPVLVLGTAEKQVAYRVDEVLNEQEVLVKSLGKQLTRVRNVAGCTVLGSGRVVPILNVSDLMKSDIAATISPARLEGKPAETTAVNEEIEGRKKSILVVEDSITSRSLLKNILKLAGYEVNTAVDGLEGFTKLREIDVDLVVSDVDMPRMNGFALTSKIRNDKKLAELPVVLVTSLDSREDREQGIDVGANAYIVKSSFDQSNMLEVIKRLI